MTTPNYLFNVEKKTKLRRNVFSLSHNTKTTANFGQLIPIDLFPVVPGDTHNVHANIFARMAPAISPFLHEVNIYTWSFFIPNRLSWNGWEDFITDGVQGPTDPLVGTDKQFPKIRVSLYKDFWNTSSGFYTYDASEWIGFFSLVPSSDNKGNVARIHFHGGGFGSVGSIFDHMGIPPLESSPYILRLQERLSNEDISRDTFKSWRVFKYFDNRDGVPDDVIYGPTMYVEPTGKRWNMLNYIWKSSAATPIPNDFPIVSMRGKYMHPGDSTTHVGGSTLGSGSSIEDLTFSALPLDCYLHVYNEYFRDQNLEEPKILLSDEKMNDSPIINESNGVVCNDWALQFSYVYSKCWEKDYFTSALPWAQRGGAAELPLTGIDGAPIQFNAVGEPSKFIAPDGLARYTLQLEEKVNSPYRIGAVSSPGDITSNYGEINNANSLSVNGESISGPTVNDLRRVVAIQQLLEASARGGSRYIEQILTIFGVRGSDSRFQRPEYLGGGKQPLTIGEVLQTSESGSTPQANPAGRGYTIGNKNGFKRYFNEHGYVLTLMTIVPRTSYMQGLSKDWFKFDRYDFYWPQFAHLGEQEIVRRELNAYADEGVGSSLFGYTPRYAEYKTRLNEIHGEFRTNLDFWHLARIFSGTPILDKDFVAINPQLQPHGELLNRVFAVQDDTSSHFWFDIQFKHRASRLMPMFGTPQLI